MRRRSASAHGAWSTGKVPVSIRIHVRRRPQEGGRCVADGGRARVQLVAHQAQRLGRSPSCSSGGDGSYTATPSDSSPVLKRMGVALSSMVMQGPSGTAQDDLLGMHQFAGR